MPFSTLETIDCPICRFNCIKLIHVQIVNKYAYNYSFCKICGYVFQLRRYDRNHYEKLPYQTQKDYEDHSKRRASYIFDFIWKDLTERACFITSNMFLLDIGCGRGGVMKYIKNRLPFADITGYTLDMGEKKATDLNIMHRNIEDLNIHYDKPLEKYDVILMTHVLEHFYDLRTAMHNIDKLLAVDGLLYIEVPSFHWCGVRMPVWTPEHLSYFTKRSLTNLLIQNGFQILKMKDSKYWGNIKILAQRALTFDRNIKPEYGWWTMAKHYMAKLMYPYYKLKRTIFKPGANE